MGYKTKAIVISVMFLSLLVGIYFFYKANNKESISINSTKHVKELQEGIQYVLEIDSSNLKEHNIEEARENIIKVIEKRLISTKIESYNIFKVSNNRITLQVPYMNDSGRLIELVAIRGNLEFKLVETTLNRDRTINAIDKYFVKNNLEDIKSIAEENNLPEMEAYQKVKPFSEFIVENGLIRPAYINYMQPYFDSLFVSRKIVRSDAQIALQKVDNETRENKGLPFIVLNSNVELDGRDISDASWSYSNNSSELKRNPTREINLSFDKEGAAIFSKVTGDNVGRQLAIMLDNLVYSAPRINGKISGGRAQITGYFTIEEARDLANILNSGALSAPIRLISNEHFSNK